MCMCRQGPNFCQNLIYVCVGSVYFQGFGLDGAGSCPLATPPLSASGIPPLRFSSPDLGPQPGNHGCAVIPCLFPSAQSAPLMKLAQIILFLPFYPGTKTLLSTALREAGEGHGMSLPNADSLKAES